MKRLGSILGTLLVVAVILGVGYIKYWSIFGQKGLGGDCTTRVDCRTYWCLAHATDGSAQVKSPGYCTEKCDSDDDCKGAPSLKCVTPTVDSLDDLAKLGRPKKLCMRQK